MPILMTVAGMPKEHYEGMFAALGDPVRRAPGFVAHFAQETPDGVVVQEVWETREQFDTFFRDNVAPNVPPGAPEPDVTELLNATGR
jgi:heme-degrading monooxygenase HmoA